MGCYGIGVSRVISKRNLIAGQVEYRGPRDAESTLIARERLISELQERLAIE